MPKVVQILGNYLAWDLEWNSETGVIEAFSWVEANGEKGVKLRIRDCGGSERQLLTDIMAKLLKYKWSMGWNTQGHPKNASSIATSDLSIIYNRCKALGKNCIVSRGNGGVPYLGGDFDVSLKHIDLCNAYGKAMIQDGIYNNKYRTHKLDDVSKALLGYGKYNNISGKDFLSLPTIEEQEKYSLTDSELVMKLSKHNNFEVLDALFAVTQLTGLDFERVCRTNLSTWCAAIVEQMVRNGECKPFEKHPKGEKYRGADVLIPKKGLYNNIVVVDGKSLYPSVGINFNVSAETINCKCCVDKPEAKISSLIPKQFTTDLKFVNSSIDWICRQHTGVFPTKLKVFKAERLKQKALGNKAKQHVLKILINGWYGLHGDTEYAFYNPKVAELVTAAGRYMLSKMQSTANHVYGFDIIYGDTDSLFCNNISSDKSLLEFQDKFNKEYDIELEIKNRYDKLILSAGKKHYIGYENGIIDSVGMEGKKSDRPELYRKVYDKMINQIIKDEGVDPIPDIRKIMSDLDSGQLNLDSLKISKRINQDEYKNKSTQVYKIAKELNAKKGDLVEYFSANEKKTGKSWSTNSADIDIPHYKQLLWNTIDEVLEIAGYPVEELAEEFGVKLVKPKSKPKKTKKKKSKDEQNNVIITHRNNSIENNNNNTGGDL